MLVSQVFVISKLGKKKKKRIRAYKSISLAHLELLENKTKTADHWLSKPLVSEPSFWSQEWIILKWEKLSSGHGGQVPQICTMALVKRPQIDFLWKKRCLRQADANLCRCGQMILAQWKGYGFHTPSSTAGPRWILGPWRWCHSWVSLPYRFCLLDQCLLRVEETLLVNYITTHTSWIIACVLCVA